MHKETLLTAARAQRAATLRRVATLPDPAWDQQVPPPPPPPGVVRLDTPARTLRDIVAHLVVVDEMAVRGGALRGWVSARRGEPVQPWDRRRIAPLASLSVTELVTLLARRGQRFAQLLAAAPAAIAHVPVRGPFGRQPLLHVVARRVLHEWLHEHDVAAVAGGAVSAAPAPEIAATLADAVLAGLPAATLPLVPRSRGVVRLLVAVAPDADGEASQQRAWAVDFGRHLYGPRVVTPADATVHLSTAALTLLASRRATPEDPELGVRIEGDTRLGLDVLARLALPSEQGRQHSPRPLPTAP